MFSRPPHEKPRSRSWILSQQTRWNYLTRRLFESPISFLADKARLELRKHRFAAMACERRWPVARARFAQLWPAQDSEMDAIQRSLGIDILAEVRAGLAHARGKQLDISEDFDRGYHRCLGYGLQKLVEGRWHEDEFHNHAWSKSYFATIDLASFAHRCDIKIPWEKSRMQWLTRAALACHLDPRTSRVAERLSRIDTLLCSWDRDNPFCVGANWASSMEVAIRSINLALSVALLFELGLPNTKSIIQRSLRQHEAYLHMFPEISDVPGNHYLATVLGQLVCAYVLASRALDSAAEEFVRVVQLQFEGHGLHCEYSPTYHRLCLEMAAIGYAFLLRFRPTLAVELEPTLASASQAAATLADARGNLPIFGDHDSGKVIDFGSSTRSIRTVANFHTRTSSASWRKHHLVGAAKLEGPHGLENIINSGIARSNAPRTAFDAWKTSTPAIESTAGGANIGPFRIIERGGTKLVVRVGPRGLAGRASHDHDDCLSFWLSHDGIDLVAERGSPPYTRSIAERLEALSSLGHNVIQSPGRMRFRPSIGSVMPVMRDGAPATATWSTRANQPWLDTAMVIPLRGGNDRRAVHDRRFHLDESGSLRIEDFVALTGSDQLEFRLHLAPGQHEPVTTSSGSTLEVHTERLRAQIYLEEGALLECRQLPYSCNLEYGQAQEGICVSVIFEAGRRARLCSLLTPVVSAPLP